MTEVASHMVWVCWLGKSRLMTLITIVERKLIVVVRMTQLALCSRVRTCQRKIREIMIVQRAFPRHGRVALYAIMAVVASDMVRVTGI
jgi:hypothetical protein